MTGLVRRALGAALALTLTSAALPAAAEDGDPSLRQRVAADEHVVDEQVEISSGHVDIGPKVVDGEWQLMIRDDSQSPAVWRDPADVVLRVVDDAVLTAPTGGEYSFLDDASGRPVHVVPQTQRPEVIWVGWNTQDPAAASLMGSGASLRLRGHSGPGRMWMFLQDGAFGQPQLLWDTAPAGGGDGAPAAGQDVWMEVGTHTHANWVFGEPGASTIAVSVSATGEDGGELSDTAVLRLAVGDDTSTAAARSAPAPSALAPIDDDGASEGAKGAEHGTDAAGALGAIGVTELVTACLAGLAVLALALLVLARRRSRALRSEVSR